MTEGRTISHVPRQQRAIETRRRLLDAGRDAFGRLGHDGVNLARDVLAPAGVSVGSFYHQFGDKTELLLAVMADSIERRRDWMLQSIALEPASAPPTRLVWATCDALFASVDMPEHGWRLQIRERSNVDPRVREQVLAGRSQWRHELATLLRWWGVDEELLDSTATMFVALGTGLATLYLDVEPELRAQARLELTEQATTFVSAALAGHA